MPIGSDFLSSPPPSPVNDPQGANGVAPGGAQSPGAVATLLGTSGGPGGGMAMGGGVPAQAMQGVLQILQGLSEQARQLAQTVPVMGPKLMQAVTLIEQAGADFLTTNAGATPPASGGTPGAFSPGAAFR